MIGTLLLVSLPAVVLTADDPPPRSHDPRIGLSLFAENPQIVTPTGIDVDAAGRVWAIESNTHFPPEGYTGHPTDRVLVMTDADGDGRCDKIVVFRDGLTFTMSVAVRPAWLAVSKDGIDPATVVYIATRMALFRCDDRDNDQVCDEQTRIVHLETKGDYPHNGLAGFAFDLLGRLFFGFGENLGADYKIIGSDGTTLSGGGEGGNIYRCRLDGSKLDAGRDRVLESARELLRRLRPALHRRQRRRQPSAVPAAAHHSRRRLRLPLPQRPQGTAPLHRLERRDSRHAADGRRHRRSPSGILCLRDRTAFPKSTSATSSSAVGATTASTSSRSNRKGRRSRRRPKPLITGGENFRPVGFAVAPDGSLYLHRLGAAGLQAAWPRPHLGGLPIRRPRGNTPPAGRLLPPAIENPRLDKRRGVLPSDGVRRRGAKADRRAPVESRIFGTRASGMPVVPGG